MKIDVAAYQQGQAMAELMRNLYGPCPPLLHRGPGNSMGVIAVDTQAGVARSYSLNQWMLAVGAAAARRGPYCGRENDPTRQRGLPTLRYKREASSPDVEHPAHGGPVIVLTRLEVLTFRDGDTDRLNLRTLRRVFACRDDADAAWADWQRLRTSNRG